jgi:hypothetical protein
MIITCPDTITRRAIVDALIEMLNKYRESASYVPEIKIVQADKLSVTIEPTDQRSFITDADELKRMIEGYMEF